MNSCVPSPTSAGCPVTGRDVAGMRYPRVALLAPACITAGGRLAAGRGRRANRREVFRQRNAVPAVVRRWTTFAALPAAILLGASAAHAGWAAHRVYDPITNDTRCVAESDRVRIHDGYQQTELYLRASHDAVLVMTDSNVDARTPDVGISVDGQGLMPPDEIYREQNALFRARVAELVDQFKSGLRAEVRLRFWPTWPPKGRKTAVFSLIGFRDTFAKLPGC